MKVNPIQNYPTQPNYVCSRVQNQSQPDDVSVNNTTLPLAYKPIFKGGVDMAKKVMAAPFDDKFAVAQKLMQPYDVMLASKDLKKSEKYIKDFFNSRLSPVARFWHMQVPKIDETMLFIKKPDSSMLMWNVGVKPILIDGFNILQTQNMTEINEGEHIRLTGKWYEIKEEPETDFDLEEYSSMFLKKFDFSEDAQKCTKAHNDKVMDAILHPEKNQKQNVVKKTLSFDSVGGQDENIKILKRSILYPMRYPDVFKDFMINRGVILAGPPGTGKTLLAKALVAESGASSFELCATDLSAKYVGESEENCRKLFATAVEAQPSIIYFDEFDALAKSRGSSDVHGDKLLNQLLSLMSDIEMRKDNVFVIASTNRKDALDSAILRSGRFGLQLEINAPDLAGTKQILGIHTKNKPLDKNLDMDKLAEKMFAKKMTGAEIADVVNRAHSNALERCDIFKSMDENRFSPTMMDYMFITEEDFEKALKDFKADEKGANKIGFKK